MSGKIRCPICQGVFKKLDYVYLDDWNGLKHKHCVDYMQEKIIIEDEGTFQEIVEKYDFFKENTLH